MSEQQAAAANTQSTEAAKALPEGWIFTKMEVAKNEGEKGNQKRVSLGTVLVPVPTLAAYGINAEQETEEGEDKKQHPAFTVEGLPIYKDSKYDFLQSAIRAGFYINARNRLISNTKELQPGKSFISSWADLDTLGDRDGTHLKNRAACVAAFAGFIKGTGKPDNIVDNWKRLMRDPASMASQLDGIKEKAQQYLRDFIDSISKEELPAYMPTITAMDDASKTSAPDVSEY